MFIKVRGLLEKRGMRKQSAMTRGQKHVQLCIWKRLILIPTLLFSGGLLVTLAPGQVAYAEASWPQNVFLCRAGDGGNGGVANNGSNGAAGAPGGDCVNGPKAGNGGAGGDHGSPGGLGGSIV
jgi:hypothetical protein